MSRCANWKQEERAVRKRQKDLERALKEQAKLSALEQARLAFEAHENAIDLLLSVHKECSTKVDWHALACRLPPHSPSHIPRHELAAHFMSASSAQLAGDDDLKHARYLDDCDFQEANRQFQKQLAEWLELTSLAKRVIAGDVKAFSEVISEFSSFAEISNLGSTVDLAFHGSHVAEGRLKVNGRDVIPTETKSLSASGKLLTKPMPKSRFHEIYQDYVCSCVLRLSRELFALLPIDTVLVTATVDSTDSRTGHAFEVPVLSVVIPRNDLENLNFERLDPSDSIEIFLHRGDVKASRKSENFEPITPFTPSELAPSRSDHVAFTTLLDRVRRTRSTITAVPIK
jgi:hypothetical protein